MSRKTLLVLLVVLATLTALAVVGYQVVRTKAMDKTDRLVTSVTGSLPPGTRLTWEGMRLHPFTLSATLDRVHLTNPDQRLDGLVSELTVSDPVLDGTSLTAVTVTATGVALSAERGGKPVTGRVREARVEDLRIRETIAIARALKDVRALDDLDPEVLARLSIGPITLSDVTVATADVGARASLGSLALGPIEAGRLSRVEGASLALDAPQAALRLDGLSLEGLDLPRAARWLRRTEGRVLTPKGRPDLDTLGIDSLSLTGVGMEAEGLTLSAGRLALEDWAVDQGSPVRLALAVDRLALPAALLDREHRAFLDRHGLSGVSVDARWTHDLANGPRTLHLGPVSLDGGPFGLVSGSLDLDGVDLESLLTVVEQPERLLESARLAGASVTVGGGRITAAYLDFLLGQADMTRDDIHAILREDLGQDVIDILGPNLGDPLIAAMDAFVAQPGVFAFSARALDTPMNLTQLTKGLSLVPEAVLSVYDVQVTHTTRQKE